MALFFFLFILQIIVDNVTLEDIMNVSNKERGNVMVIRLEELENVTDVREKVLNYVKGIERMTGNDDTWLTLDVKTETKDYLHHTQIGYELDIKLNDGIYNGNWDIICQVQSRSDGSMLLHSTAELSEYVSSDYITSKILEKMMQ